jgi:hypothetical protein
MVEKISKKKGDFLRCPECKNEVPIEADKEEANSEATA